jgi:hypothetical protein
MDAAFALLHLLTRAEPFTHDLVDSGCHEICRYGLAIPIPLSIIREKVPQESFHFPPPAVALLLSPAVYSRLYITAWPFVIATPVMDARCIA